MIYYGDKMDVALPTTGCNILNNSTTFYNYSNNNRTRTTYVIYDGEAHVTAVSNSTTGYNYTGDCLVTGDLVYKPELQVYFPALAFCSICFILIMIYRIFIKRLLP